MTSRALSYRTHGARLILKGLEDCAVAGRLYVEAQIAGKLDLQLRAEVLNALGESKIERGQQLRNRATEIEAESAADLARPNLSQSYQGARL